jgi:hypothetical protein
MYELSMGIAAGVLTVILRELQIRLKARKISINPPPPDAEVCKRCFFYRQFANTLGEANKDSDTTIIRLYRKIENKDE